MLESLVTQVAGFQLCKIRLRRRCFPCSYLNFLTATFLALNKLWKKHSCKKHGSEDIYRKSNYATFCFTLRQDFCISGIENGLYEVLLVKKKIIKEVNNTTAAGLWQSLTCQNSNRYQSTDIHDRVNYLCTAPRKRFISWVFLTVPLLFYQVFQ